MANKQLSEKLDQLSVEELGIAFDEAEVWTRLDQRLDNRRVFIYWGTVAACVLMGLLFLPISVLREAKVETAFVAESVETSTSEEVVEIIPQVESVSTQHPKVVVPGAIDRKQIASVGLAEIAEKSLSLERIQLKSQKEIKSALTFAAEDISIIQASLELPSIEKGKSITVRAQLQSFPSQVKSKQKVFKIKLNEKQ